MIKIGSFSFLPNTPLKAAIEIIERSGQRVAWSSREKRLELVRMKHGARREEKPHA